jgi:transcriptional regulator GlxA family with amidase domain
MVNCLANEKPNVGSAWRHHTAIINRFEEVLAAKGDRPLHLAEICAAIGVSERTLRSCCEEHLGMGPIRYLWLRRMHLSRLALLRADPAKTTVTQIATDHGFWELGRFSVAYHALFGEPPSASLRKPRTITGRSRLTRYRSQFPILHSRRRATADTGPLSTVQRAAQTGSQAAICTL